jgi:hypothetical protein
MTVATYKPGPQARYLVEKMATPEKTVVDALSTLTEKLASLEKKVDSYGGDLRKVQEKVDLAMQSISLVQQEQVKVAKTLRSQAGAAAMPHTSVGVRGSSLWTPSASPGTSTSSLASHTPPRPPPPLPPSDNLLRNHQVHPRAHNSDGSVLEIDRVENRNH